MANQLLTRRLFGKMDAEQDAYFRWLVAQPPKEILNHASEYALREDILYALDEMDFLSDEQVQALLSSPSPLQDITRQFWKMETDHMDDVRLAMEDTADDLIAAAQHNAQTNQEKTVSAEAEDEMDL